MSPPLRFGGLPPGARSLALVVEDADSPTPAPLVHALVWDIPAEENHGFHEAALDADAMPTTRAGATMGKNSFLSTGWLPPDPPTGHGPHRYCFQVFALDVVPELGGRRGPRRRGGGAEGPRAGQGYAGGDVRAGGVSYRSTSVFALLSRPMPADWYREECEQIETPSAYARHTTAMSDKRDKVLAHRAERGAVRAALAANDDVPDHKQFGDPWQAAKDGKAYRTNATADVMRK